jgi:tRNA-splicing ligase RtcB (3'-phosphate/5'-hydroxy nucleic acid ligase)
MSIQQIDNPYGIDVRLFANKEVDIDRSSINELLEFLKLAETLEQLKKNDPFFFNNNPEILRVVLTPDFHRGAGIPIGTVLEAKNFLLPQAVGKDISCGMRLVALNLTVDEFNRIGRELDAKLRHIFFQGGRNVVMNAKERVQLFQRGLIGLHESIQQRGIWDLYNYRQGEEDLMHTHHLGQWSTNSIFEALEDFLQKDRGDTYDDQLGSIGGGNHFVEIQRIDEIMDGATARQWGLKKDNIAIMAHSGSVGIGHVIGAAFVQKAKENWPSGLSHPSNGFYPLRSTQEDAYLSAMANAANFAFANRLVLSLMAIRALQECLGRNIEHHLVYDAPHNLIWSKDETHLHRKGACPAEGPDTDIDFPYGHPVIVPGSMGAYSYVLRGHGNVHSLCSASHGAGRIVSRQKSRNVTSDLEKLRIITKIDPVELIGRPDILNEFNKTIMEEAPGSYKNITPVIDTLVETDVASIVCKNWPLLTIKG